MDFFTADTHFGHKNILNYDNRPFKSVTEMNRELIRRWNDVVLDGDDVYILGDFIWADNRNQACDIVASLNGRKHIILGNHDQIFSDNMEYFIDKEELIAEIVPYKEIKIAGIDAHAVLCHYPIPFFNRCFGGWYHFYGHVHNMPEQDCCERLRKSESSYYGENVKMLNVGCMMDYMDYTPRSFVMLESVINKTSEFSGTR